MRYLPKNPATAWIENEAETAADRSLFVSLAISIGWTVIMAWYAFIELPG
ncbi:hypothetical protein ABZ260_43945 [Streptosporangium sp. NPDC006013]